VAEGWADDRGEEGASGQVGRAGGGQVGEGRAEQGADRVIAEQRSEQDRHRGQADDAGGAGGGTPWAVSPQLSADGSVAASPRMIRVKKIPIDSTVAEFWKVAVIPDPAPRLSGGRLFMIAARFGR
jgi:hypothetical protein